MSKPYTEILDLLRIPHDPGTVAISEVEAQASARIITLRCLWQANIPPMKITRTVEFRQCEHVCWDFSLPLETGVPLLADILAIQRGNDQRGNFILFVTDLFEIRITYGKMIVKLE